MSRSPGNRGNDREVDVAFGESGDMERINMFCSVNNPEGIYAIVRAATNVRYLDIRGNKLGIDMGRKLLASIKNPLQLQSMNGMNLAAIRENKMKRLNLVSLKSTNDGLFGIEVCGALFLAKFLAVNTSLEGIKFQNNHVGKEGTLEICRAILNNEQSNISSVNHMGIRRTPGKKEEFKGFDLKELRQNKVSLAVDLSDTNLADEDLIFLMEVLEKYDCVRSLDLSYNVIHEDGFAAILQYLSRTKTLSNLNLAMAPLTTDHLAALAKGIQQNKTLRSINFHIGSAVGVHNKQKQVIHDIAQVLIQHPTLSAFGEAPIQLDKIKNNQMTGYNPFEMKKLVKYRNDIAMCLWLIALCKPKSFTSLTYNNNRRPKRVSYPEQDPYPDVVDFVESYWPPIASICLNLKDTLKVVDIGIPDKLLDAVELMRYLQGSTSLEQLHLRGFAGTEITNVPQEWNGLGGLPSYLTSILDKRLKHWQVINGFVEKTPTLKAFNHVRVGDYKNPKSAERAMLLLAETVVDCVITVDKSSSPTTLKIALGRRADLSFIFHATRLVTESPYRIELNYLPDLVYGHNKVIAKRNEWTQMAYQQHDLVKFLAENSTYIHVIALKHGFTIPEMFDTLIERANIRELSIDAIEKVLPKLVKAVQNGTKCKLERLTVTRYWNTNRAVLKKFHQLGNPAGKGDSHSEYDLLKQLQQSLTELAGFKEIITPGGKFGVAQLKKSTLDQFAQQFSGVLVKYPPVAGVYTPNILLEFVFDPKNSKFPERGYRRMGMMLPLAPAHRGIRVLNLANCKIKDEIRSTARSDEFADSSRPLWEGKMVNYRPFETGPFKDQEHDYMTYKRFHWNPDVRIGSRDAEIFLKTQGFVVEKDMLRLIIVALLKSPALTDLDLRGNGFTHEDAQILLDELEKNKTLKTLNAIPLSSSGAAKLEHLQLDGTNVGPITPQMKESKGQEKAYGQDTCKYSTVEMSDGDGLIFSSLVTSKNFPKLHHLSILKHRIPDIALAHICDTIASVPGLDTLDLTKIYVSNRGSNMLLQVICKRAENIRSLNGLPLSVLAADTHVSKTNSVQASKAIDWNEYTLAVATKLKLWGALKISDKGGYMEVDKRGLTDVGLRGISGKMKFDFQTPDSMSSVRSAPILKLDLSGNRNITDAAVADLCRNLLQPTTVPSLQYLDLRYCQKLRSRSAYELYGLLHPKGRPATSVGTNKLQVINGVNIDTLAQSAKAGKAAPPFVIRLSSGNVKESLTLSESDCHFFAHVLHLFSNVPLCHVHIELSRGQRIDSWQGETVIDSITSDSSFPAPKEESTDHVQKQIDAANRLFACIPVSTRAQFSAIPRIPLRVHHDSSIGDVLVAPHHSAATMASSGGHFGHMVAAFLKRKETQAKQFNIQIAGPKKPYYVNNINQQRVHDCFRTLYGVDDVELTHEDVLNRKDSVQLSKVDFGSLFSSCTSIDLQHLWFSPIDHMQSFTKASNISALTHLNLPWNNFGDAGLRQLCQQLVASNSLIAHMNLLHNNISDAGVRHLCGAMRHLPKLTSLDLAHNFIGESGGIVLAEALGGVDLTNNEEDRDLPEIRLLSLNVEGNKIRDRGGMRIAEFVTVNKHLQFLNLRDNEIGFTHDEAIAALVYCVTDNAVLSVTDIRDNFQKKRGSRYEKSKPPHGLMQGLLQEVQLRNFDENEAYQGVFIRRKR